MFTGCVDGWLEMFVSTRIGSPCLGVELLVMTSGAGQVGIVFVQRMVGGGIITLTVQVWVVVDIGFPPKSESVKLLKLIVVVPFAIALKVIVTIMPLPLKADAGAIEPTANQYVVPGAEPLILPLSST